MAKSAALDSIFVRNPVEDLIQALKFVEELLLKNKVPTETKNETLIILESLCNRIYEQVEIGTEIRIQVKKKLGRLYLRIFFEGDIYDQGQNNISVLSPDESILNGFSDRIDYSYPGYNKIHVSVKRSRESAVLFSLLAAVVAIIAYLLIHFLGGSKTERTILNNVINPGERLFINLAVMVGTPLTFFSFMKNLTDTYIVMDRSSGVRKLWRYVARSSFILIVLAIFTSWLCAPLFGDPAELVWIGENNLIQSVDDIFLFLIPSDIFTPFMGMSPFPVLILAVILTISLCSIGKYFDKMKGVIDTCYALFSRMLGVVTLALPIVLVFAILDILLDTGVKGFGYLGLTLLVVLMGLVVVGLYYVLVLMKNGIPVVPFIRQMWPMLRENYFIASSIDAASYNIRYCNRTWKMDWDKLENNIPVLAEINLDGTCFFVMLFPLVVLFSEGTEVSLLNLPLIGILVFFLSLGAPNQPGAFLIGMLIVMNYLQVEALVAYAVIFEVFFSGILNLVNVIGCIVTAASIDPPDTGLAGPDPS